MQTNVMMDCLFKISPVMEGNVELSEMTVGDRLDWLLKSQGRRDRQDDYTQYDLTDFLTGAATAPNGKRYNIKTNRSSVNRYVMNKREMPYEILVAICEIFGVSADWLLRGEEFDVDAKDQWMHEETGELAAIVDKLPEHLRQVMMTGAQTLQRLNQQLEQAELERIEFLRKIKTLLPEQERLQAVSILEKMGGIRNSRR